MFVIDSVSGAEGGAFVRVAWEDGSCSVVLMRRVVVKVESYFISRLR